MRDTKIETTSNARNCATNVKRRGRVNFEGKHGNFGRIKRNHGGSDCKRDTEPNRRREKD